MPAPDEPSYFHAIEEALIRLRGAPLLLSPDDWQLARGWQERGIPLQLVLRTLAEVFERHREREGDGRIQTLRYCAPAVERAWRSASGWAATGRREEPEPLDVKERLGRLADELPPGFAALAERVRTLQGAAEEVEEALAELDGELLSQARARLPDDRLRELAAGAQEAAARLLERLPEGETPETLRRLEVRAIRRELGLPVLSLFSAAALPG